MVIVAALATIGSLTGCQGSSDASDDAAEPVATQTDHREPRTYDIEWTINAEAVGVDGPGYAFRYREVVDDRRGRYLVRSPDHVAVQTPDRVLFCAAILRADPYCAATGRAEGAPNVLSYPVQLLRSWGPDRLYELAGYREVSLVAAAEPNAWDITKTAIADTPVECFAAVQATSAAAVGFEVCFVADEHHLVASVDLNGDRFYEIDLAHYRRGIDDESFVTGLEPYVEEKARLQDQLIAMFPDIPAPRPTPTPDPEAGSDS